MLKEVRRIIFCTSCSLINFIFTNNTFFINWIRKNKSNIFADGIEPFVGIQFLYYNLGWVVTLSFVLAVIPAGLLTFGRFLPKYISSEWRPSDFSLLQIILPISIVYIVLAIPFYMFLDKVLPEFNHKARNYAVSIALFKSSDQKQFKLN